MRILTQAITVDPVIERARRERDPFHWSRSQISKGRMNPLKRFFGEAVAFGIEGDVTVPICAGFDRFAAFTFAADKCGSDFQQRFARAKDFLQLIGVYFHAHVEATLKPSVFLRQPSELSQRETQCLA